MIFDIGLKLMISPYVPFTTHKCNVFYYLLKLTRLFFPYFLANPLKRSTFASPSMTVTGLRIPKNARMVEW